MIANSVTDLIGDTPLVKINSLEGEIYGKCECTNPGGSVKDRIGWNMIKRALDEGVITKDTPLVEPTSGNTGIALAMVAASLGLDLTIVMPESMSMERRKLLRFLGAKLVLTPAANGMQGAIEKAKEIAEQKEGYMFNQFANPHNPEIHALTTAQEILRDLPDVGIFVTGVGTGGTITGVGSILQPKGVKIFAVEPKKSPVLSGGKPGPHKIQGIGAGFIPPILDTTIFAEAIPIEDEEAMEMSRHIAKKEGLLVGISSGANLVAAQKLALRYPGEKIVTMLCDSAERYLSTELFD